MREIRISKDIVLRHIELSDAEVFFEAEQDVDARKNFMRTPSSVKVVEEDIEDEIQEYGKENPSSEKFTILYKGDVAGWIAINQLNNKFFEHRAKVDFCLHSNFRGKGIMFGVLKEVVSYAFKKYKLKRLEAWTRNYNKAVAKLCEKSGFKLEGVLRKNKCKDGEYLDDMIWAVVK